MPGSTGNTHQTPGEMVGGPEATLGTHQTTGERGGGPQATLGTHQTPGERGGGPEATLGTHWEHIRHQVRGVVDLRLLWSRHYKVFI